jgi:hypothetical protein
VELLVVILGNSARAWNTDAFQTVLKADIRGLGAGSLPLQQAATGWCVDESDVQITVLGSSDSSTEIQVNIGVFFTEIIAGCSCGDAPSASTAYCELRVSIDKANGHARFETLHD